MTNTMM